MIHFMKKGMIDKLKEYVLLSQGIEIYRTKNKEEAEKIMNDENHDWYQYKQECLDNNESYADNSIEMFEEDLIV